MSFNGGYIMIDCKGLDLTGGTTPQTKTGLYSKVKTAMGIGKPIFAYNCVWGDDGDVSPIQVFAIDMGEYGIYITASTLQIRVSSADSVIIINLIDT